MPCQPAAALRFSVARETPGLLDLRITDTGVGMDEAASARIFEPYFSTKTTGTGSGLTIAKRNVEANGGSIAVTSQRGVGHDRHDVAAGRGGVAEG